MRGPTGRQKSNESAIEGPSRLCEETSKVTVDTTLDSDCESKVRYVPFYLIQIILSRNAENFCQVFIFPYDVS